MRRSVHEVSATDLWRAIAQIDAAAAVAPGLVTGLAAGRPPALARVLVTSGAADDQVVVADPLLPVRYALPGAALRAIRSAALTLTAARLLMAPGVVTAAVLDTTDTAGPRALLVARQLPDVDHVMVHGPTHSWPTQVLAPRGPAAVGFGFTGSLDEAVFGASLVVVAGQPRCGARPAQLAHSALVVNATGRPLPDGLFSGVDVRFVDDRTLYGTAWEEPTGSLPVHADLRELIEPATRAQVEPIAPDLVALVDLLGSGALDLHLAHALCHTPALSAGAAPSMF